MSTKSQRLLLMSFRLCVSLAAIALGVSVDFRPKSTKLEEALNTFRVICAYFAGIPLGLAVGAVAGNPWHWCTVGVLVWPAAPIGLYFVWTAIR
jgi:hypothetical protein